MTNSRKNGFSTPKGELERLRELILGDRVSDINALYRRVDDPESRTEDVAEVLPDAMHRVIDDPLAKPRIEKPIVDTIRGAIKHDTESFAEALFPVLGPAIRRAVADSLRSLVQRINAAIEHSFSAKGLRWRLEAARSGVPFGQIVLRETMAYAVQEVFLVQHDSGLVLASARLDDTLMLDEDAFSSMLSAIQSFIQDSLGLEQGTQLRSAELGDRTLWVIDGPGASLACLVIGTPPLEVREQLMDTLETLHARYNEEFHGPPERLSDPVGIENLLNRTLLGEVAESKSSPFRSRLLWGLAVLALLAWAGWAAWTSYSTYRVEQQLVARFSSESGYVLTSHEAKDDLIILTGLRDPLSESPGAVIQDTEVDPALATLNFRPYQSLETPFVLERLKSSLGDGGEFTLDIQGHILTVRGSITAAQLTIIENLQGTHPVIQSVNLDQTWLDPVEAARLIRQRLNVPAAVEIAPSGDRTMTLSGPVLPALYIGVVTHEQPIGGWEIDFSGLQNSLADRLVALVDSLNGRTLSFTRQFVFTPASVNDLDRLGAELMELQELAGALKIRVAIKLVGYADGLGLPDANRALASGRAEALRSELSTRGVDPAKVETAVGHWESGSTNPDQRKVVVQVAREPVR